MPRTYDSTYRAMEEGLQRVLNMTDFDPETHHRIVQGHMRWLDSHQHYIGDFTKYKCNK